MSHEQEPDFCFPWQFDEDGEYLSIADGDRRFRLDKSNTCMYLYPGELSKYDHIFVRLATGDEDVDYGLRLWKRTLDETLGEGIFKKLIGDLFHRDFMLDDEEEPSQLDYEAWHETFPDDKQQTIDEIVSLAMSQFDNEWDFYQDEPDWS